MLILQPAPRCRIARASHFLEDARPQGAVCAWPALRPSADPPPWLCAGLLFLLLLAVGCTSSDAPRRHTVDAPLVPFNELFALEDTIRLDPSILIGQVTFLDVNQEGHLLVSDMIGKSIYRFSASGEYVMTYSVSECLPDEKDFTPMASRFIDGDRILTMNIGGPFVVFDAAGNCLAASRRLSETFISFCAKDDSLHMLPISGLPSGVSVAVYSAALERLGETRVEDPEFRELNLGRYGHPGRTLECFNDGPYYTYLGIEDAIPVRANAETVRALPPFFVKRKQDLRPNLPLMEAVAEIRAYPRTIAVFGIDSLTRMIRYKGLRDKWHSDTQIAVGLSVVSNISRFPARSTLFPGHPVAAGYGYLYNLGDNEPLADGEVGNPVITRYRFIPPTNSDE